MASQDHSRRSRRASYNWRENTWSTISSTIIARGFELTTTQTSTFLSSSAVVTARTEAFEWLKAAGREHLPRASDLSLDLLPEIESNPAEWSLDMVSIHSIFGVTQLF